MSIRLDDKTKSALAKIAQHEKRSRSFLAAEAVEQYVAFHEAQIMGIKKAIVSLDAGGGIPHEKVVAWVNSWGTDNELPMPTA